MSIKSSIRKFNRKPLWKRILATVLGLVTIGGAVFGVTKLVEYVNDDLKTIHPSFEVGALGTDGKYVEDEEKLYTKDAFRCDGLQVELDFDNEINYKIFFYDDVGNFVSSTDVLSEGVDASVAGTYARIEITPTNEDVEDISWMEKNDLSNQLTVKVFKNQSSKYLTLGGRRLLTTRDPNDLIFTRGCFMASTMTWQDETEEPGVVTGTQLLSVDGQFKKISFSPFVDVNIDQTLLILQLKLNDGVLVMVSEPVILRSTENIGWIELDKESEYIVFVSRLYTDMDAEGNVSFLTWTDAQIAELPSRILYK